MLNRIFDKPGNAMDIKLGHDVFAVSVNCADTDTECVGDVMAGHSLGAERLVDRFVMRFHQFYFSVYKPRLLF